MQNAPIKGQCAKSYFYGRDLDLEKLLGELEGKYAEALRKLPSATGRQLADWLDFLRSFAHLQTVRTETVVARRRQMTMEMQNLAYAGWGGKREETDLSQERLIRQSIQSWLALRASITDLKSVLFLNETQFDFVTSDNPAFFSNRLYLQKIGRQSFGLISSGTMLFMPLTPKILFLAYDPAVYTVPDLRGRVCRLHKPSDIHAANELQFINATENIYFLDWSDLSAIRSKFRAVADRRGPAYKFAVMVADGEDELGTKRYRRATEVEKDSPGSKMIINQPQYPIPRNWISAIHFRSNPVAYMDGSAVGFVRSPLAEGGPWKKATPR